jgi:hypothetical protein
MTHDEETRRKIDEYVERARAESRERERRVRALARKVITEDAELLTRLADE